MSGRTYRTLKTQGIEHVDYAFVILPQNTAAPKLSEGDPNGSFVTIARTGVGVYTITTADPFVAVVGWDISIMLATPAGQYCICWSAPVQNANNTWTMTFTIYNGASASDIAANANNRLSVWLRFRNSIGTP